MLASSTRGRVLANTTPEEPKGVRGDNKICPRYEKEKRRMKQGRRETLISERGG